MKTKEERKMEWKNGYHTLKDDTKIEIINMAMTHLINTIKVFGINEYDISDLKREIESREHRKALIMKGKELCDSSCNSYKN